MNLAPRLAAPLLLLLTCLAAAPVHVTVDFAAPADYPLSKSKFGVFNSGMVRPDRYARDMPLYDEVRPDSLRVDLGWGAGWVGWKTHPVGGTAGHLSYDFTETDRTATLLRDHGVPAYWSYCYTPRPLQPKPGDYQAEPTDPAAWASVLRTMAAHYRAFPGGNPVGYQEVGNEPDNRDFYTGGRDAYLRLYQLGSQAIRDGDPDAVVGGPALAFSSGWVDPFLDSVVHDHSPLDFYSFHYYPGVPYSVPDLDGVTRQMRDALQRRPGLRTAELHLNEWNPLKIDYPQGGKQDRYPMAADFLHSVKHFLDQPWLTRVYFAQFQDSGGGNYSGMISMDGHRKAVFNAYAMYRAMPVDRFVVQTDDPAIEGLAAADSSASPAHDGGTEDDVLIWNRSDTVRRVAVDLHHDVASLERAIFVERVDRAHHSYADGTPDLPVNRATDRVVVGLSSDPWDGELPAGGVVRLRYLSEPNMYVGMTPTPLSGRIVRELHDYPDRTSRCYADFDRRTWTARLGMAGEDRATARVGATVDGLGDAVAVTADLTGHVRPAAVAGVRVDYQSAGGAYTRAVLFHLTDGGGTDAPVWGTARPADGFERAVAGANTPLDVKRHAPPDWTGRVQVSFVLADGGPDVRATFRLTGR